MSKYTFVVLLMFFMLPITLPVVANTANPSVDVTVGGEYTSPPSISVLDPVMQLRDTNIVRASDVRTKYLSDLVLSIKALEDSGITLTAARRLRIAEAALYAEEQTGVSAVSMIALARMESDFKGIIMMNVHCQHGLRTTGCFADCGITQHHVRGNLDYVRRTCAQVVKDPKLSFLHSAKEIAHHVQWCSDPKRAHLHRPLRRCVLNRYNQGPFYGRAEQCDAQHRCYLLRKSQLFSDAAHARKVKECFASRRRCRIRASYWKKLTCFEYGARNRIGSVRSCRRCSTLSSIVARHYPAVEQKTPFDLLLASFLR